jgi:hypothetical protein
MGISSNSTLALSNDERNRRNQAFGQVNQMIQPASSFLSGIYGPGGMSDWKRGQTQQRTSDTTHSFNNALSGQRQRANMSGFGYNQPAEQAGETNIENARASELARIPGQVEAEALPMQMQAASLQNSLAGTEMGMGNSYDPMGYYKTAVGQDEAEKQRKAALWSGIAGIGGKFTNLIPGMK